jgi:hypothetical protein
MPTAPAKKIPASKQVAAFIAKFDARMQREARAGRAWLRQRLPGATELVYDNYNGLVFGFGPNEKANDAPLSLVILPDHLTLCFLHGADLRDPERLLKGAGSRVRHIKLQAAKELKQPAIRWLIDQAVDRNRVPLPTKKRGPTLVRMALARHRPRRP